MSKTTNKFAPEVRQRAVRMVLDHEADPSIALGSRHIDSREDRLLGAHAAGVGEEGGGEQRQARRMTQWNMLSSKCAIALIDSFVGCTSKGIPSGD